MAVKITHKGKTSAKTKVPSKATSALADLAEMADEYGELSQKITELQADPAIAALLEAQKAQGKLATKIKAKADEALAEDEKRDVSGKKHTLTISAKGSESKVKEDGGKEAIFEYLGEETFVSLCKFGITELRQYLNPKQLEDVLVTTHSKSRTIKLK